MACSHNPTNRVRATIADRVAGLLSLQEGLDSLPETSCFVCDFQRCGYCTLSKNHTLPPLACVAARHCPTAVTLEVDSRPIEYRKIDVQNDLFVYNLIELCEPFCFGGLSEPAQYLVAGNRREGDLIVLLKIGFGSLPDGGIMLFEQLRQDIRIQ